MISSDVSHALNINLGGNTGKVIFGALNTYVGSTSLNAGTLVVGPSSSLGAISNTLNITSATLDLQNDLQVGSLVMSGTLPAITNTAGTSSLTVSGTSTLANSVVTSGAQTYTGVVTLGADTSITTADSSVIFGSSITNASAKALTIISGAGNVSVAGVVGDVASGAALSNIIIDSAGITTLNGAVKAASLSEIGSTGTLHLNGATVITSAAQTYSEPVVLGVNTTLTGTTVTFADAVDAGIHSLAIVGNAIFDGALSNLSTLSVSQSTTMNGATVSSSGAQTYMGAVTLLKDTALSSSSGTIRFASTLDSDSTLTPRALSTSAAKTQFDAVVGGIAPLRTLILSGPITINTNEVDTTGTQEYVGAVNLTSTSTLTGVGITFDSSLDGAYALTLSNTGMTTFNGIVGAGTKLTSLLVTGPSTIHTTAISTSSTQEYTGAVTLSSATNLTGVGVTFDSTLDGAYGLSVNNTGMTTFNAVVGGVTQLTTLTVNGRTTIHTTAINTSSTQEFVGAVTLTSPSILTGSGVAFDSTLDGAYALKVVDTGMATFNGVVGGGVPLTTLMVTGPSTIHTGAINTSSTQEYVGGVALTSTTALTGVGISFDSTLDGAYGLSVNNTAMTAFNGSVGLGARLSSLLMNGALSINTGAVNSTGAQTYMGAVTLLKDTALSSSSGTIRFASTLDSDSTLTPRALSTSAAKTQFDAVVGGIAPLRTLILSGPITINTNEVDTTGTQEYVGAVNLTSTSTLTGVGITFDSSLDGAYALTITNTGVTNFIGPVGAASGLTNLSISTTSLSASSINLASSAVLLINNSDGGLIRGVVSGSNVALTKLGKGLLTLSGNNLFSGGTTVVEGALQAGNSSIVNENTLINSPFGLGVVNISAGTSLDLNGNSVANPLNIKGQGFNLQGALINTNPQKVATYTGTINLTGDTLFSGIGVINITSQVNAGANSLLFTSGSFNLSNASNQIGLIAAANVGQLSILSNSSLTVGTIGAVSGIASNAGLSLTTNLGKININQNVINLAQDIHISSAEDLVLAANSFVTNTGGNIYIQTPHFVNNNASPITVSATQPSNYFQVWSTNVDPFNLDPSIGDVRGGLIYNYKQYNAQYGVSQILGAGNGLLYSFAPTLTASVVGIITKIYDGNTVATLSPTNYSYSNNVDGDTVVLNYPVLGNYMTNGTGQGVTDVGTAKVVQVNGVQIVSSANVGSVQVLGYKIANTTISSPIGEITTKTITVVGQQNVNKPVDGLTTMPVGTLGWTVDSSQFISGDAAKITGFAAYDTAMVGFRKLVVGSIAITGYNAVDYTLNYVVGKGMIVPSQPILEPTPASLAVPSSSSGSSAQASPSGAGAQSSSASSSSSGSSQSSATTAGVANSSSSSAQASPLAADTATNASTAVQVAMLKAPSGVSSGVVQAEVPLSQSKGFSFNLPENLREAVSAKANDLTAKLLNDKPLPNWLTFDAKTSSFVAQNVPENGLPIKVQLLSGGQKFVVEIFKSTEVVNANKVTATGPPRPATLERSQLTLLSPRAVAQLKSSQISELNVLQIQKMTPEHLNAMTPEILAGFSPAKIAALTQSEANQLKFNQVLSLNPAQIARVNPAHIHKLVAAEIANLNDDQLKSLTPVQIAAIQPSNLGALQSEQISVLTREQIQSLSPAQFGALTPIQISSLTGIQISAVGQSHLQSLNEVQRGALLPEQIKALSASQKEALGLPLSNQPTASTLGLEDFTKIQSPALNVLPSSAKPSVNPVPAARPRSTDKTTQQKDPNSPLTSLEPETEKDIAFN